VDLYDDPAFKEKKIELLERLIALKNQPREVVNRRNLAVQDSVEIRSAAWRSRRSSRCTRTSLHLG
jgi:hypothetical protein